MKPKGLFDDVEVLDDKLAEECPHRHERPTETKWPGEDFHRLTMTCEACGRVRGRYPKEQQT